MVAGVSCASARPRLASCARARAHSGVEKKVILRECPQSLARKQGLVCARARAQFPGVTRRARARRQGRRRSRRCRGGLARARAPADIFWENFFLYGIFGCSAFQGCWLSGVPSFRGAGLSFRGAPWKKTWEKFTFQKWWSSAQMTPTWLIATCQHDKEPTFSPSISDT